MFFVTAGVFPEVGVKVSALLGVFPGNQVNSQSSNEGGAGVLGASTAKSRPLFNINVPSKFAKEVTFLSDVNLKKRLGVDGLATLNGGLITNNQDVNAGTGKITASNVLYGIRAGPNITISAGQNPTISATLPEQTAVTSLQGESGVLTLTAGTDISISGLQISNESTLDTVAARGGCSSCLTDEDVANNLTITADGSIDATAIKTGTVAVGNGGTGLSSYTTGDVLYAGSSSTLAKLGIGTTGQVLTVAGGGVPSWTDLPSGSTNYWQRNSGVLAPATITDDFALGGTTVGTSKIALYNIGAGNPAIAINGTDVLSGTTLGTGVITSSLTTVGALASGSIANGFGTIATANTITGTTINGTTGINTGAGAGTQRIDSSGNLVNIGTTQFNGQTYTWPGGGQSSGYALTTNGSGTLSWTNLGGSSTNYWAENNGALYPANLSDDFFIGGNATGSAKFAVLNVLSGTPTASVSGTTGGAYLNASGQLATTNKQSLTLGDANTGSIVLNGFGSGVIHSNAAGVLSSSVVTNADLQNSSVTVTAGTGLSGGGAVFLGGTTTLNNAGVLSLTGTSNQINVSASTGDITLSLPQDINTTSTPTFGSVLANGPTGIFGWFQRNGQAVSPTNITDDLLLGSTATVSAKFGFLNVAGGTPTASISANSGANATTLSGLGVLGTTNGQTLTLGNTTTGEVVLAPGGTTALTARGANLIGAGTLTSGGLISANGGLTVANGQNTTLTGFLQGAILYTNGSAVVTGLTGTSSQILHGGTTPSFGAVALGSEVSGVLPEANGGSPFESANGSIFERIGNQDLLLGSNATASAKFGFLNVNSGTPTASVSAGVNGGLYINASGVLATTNKQSLTLGDANTGNLVVNGFGSGVIHSNASGVLSSSAVTNADLQNSSITVTAGTGLSGGGLVSLGGSVSLDNAGVLSITGGSGGSSAITGALTLANSVTSGNNITIDDATALGKGIASFSSSNFSVSSGAVSIATGGVGATELASTTVTGATYGDAGNGVGQFTVDGDGRLTAASNRAIDLSTGDVTGILSIARGGSPFESANGSIFERIGNQDLLLGSTATASAKFGFLNVNSGTPTASISGSAANSALYINGDGTLATTNSQTLTLGGSTTGNIVLSPNNGAGIVTSTGTLNLASGKTYQIAGIDVLSGSTLGTGVFTSSLTTVGALASGSIANGFGTIATANTITGTTINGTTGINTGAGAGTQRIDSSGNLVNIGTVTASGLISANGGLTVANAQNFTLTGFTQGAVLYTNGSAVVTGATGTSSQILHGGTTPSFGAVALGSEVSGILPIANGGSPFESANGSIFERIGNQDLLLGSNATGSARFAVLNVNSGTPTASVSAGVTGGLYINASGVLATTDKQSLTLGDTNTGSIVFTKDSIFNTNLTLGGDTISDFTGDGVALSGNALTVDLLSSSASAGLANSRSGLELNVGAGSKAQLSLLQGCTNNQILKWNAPGGDWECSDDVGGESQTSAVINIQEGSNPALTGIDTLRFDGTQFDITQQSTVGIINLDSSLGLFRQANGTYYQGNTTEDFLLGGQASASAKFAVLNINNGTPTASISANSGANATTLSGLGVLGTTNKQTLTLGNASTGEVILAPGGTTALTARGANLIGAGTFTSGGLISANGGLTVANGQNTTLTGFSQGAILYTNGSAVVTGATGTASQLLHGGTTPSFGAVALGSEVSGILPIANGGSPFESANGSIFERIGTSGSLAWLDSDSRC